MKINGMYINPRHVISIRPVGESEDPDLTRYRITLTNGETVLIDADEITTDDLVAQMCPAVPAASGFYVIDVYDRATNPERWESSYRRTPVVAWRCDESELAVPVTITTLPFTDELGNTLKDKEGCILPFFTAAGPRAILTPDGLVFEPLSDHSGHTLEVYVRKTIAERNKKREPVLSVVN